MSLLQITLKKALADLKRWALICIGIFLLTLVSKTTLAVTTYTWMGTTNTKWSTNSNWSPSTGHPVAGDIVQIGFTANQPTVDVASACASITITSSSTLTLSAALTVSGGISTNSSTIFAFAGASTATFGAASSIGSSSTFTIGASNTITFNGAFTINSGSTLTNNGSLKSNSATGISSGNPGIITNSSTGTITLTASVLNVGGGTTMTNSGQIIANSASSIITNNPVTFTNSNGASITLTGSTLSFGGGTNVSNSGAITANASSTVNTTNPCPVTNSSTGTITLSASAWNLGGGSYISNSGAVAVNAASTVTFSNPSYIDNATAASTLTVSASTLDIGAGSYITNSGTLTTSAVSTVKLSGNPAYITNNVGRTFSATSTTFTMVSGTQLTNTGGTFNLTSSSISCSGNPTIITNQNSGATTGTMTLDATPITFTGTNSLMNYGTLTAKNVSPITMTSATSASSIYNYGTFYAGITNSSGNITLLGNGPTITNGVSGSNTGVFYLGSTSVLAPSSTNATISNCSTCTFTLQSDTSGTATVSAMPTGGTTAITGTITVQRFVQGSATYDGTKKRWVARNYRLLSSPVNEGVDGGGDYPYSLNYIAANTIVTNATSSYGTVTGNSSLYVYNEKYTPSNVTFTSGNFIGVTNISSTVASGNITTTDATNSSAKIYVGEGYMMYYRGDKVTHIAGSPSKTKYPYVAPESSTFSTSGNLNQGTYSVKSWTGYSGLLYTTSNAGNVSVRGFNLVGNPYPSSIDWSLFSNSVATAPIYGANINPTIYVLNPLTNNYDTYTQGTGAVTGSGSKTIPSGQGFFVQSNNHSSALTFNETAKTNTILTGSNLLLGKPVTQVAYNSYLRLKLTVDSLNYNDIVIGFNPTSTTKYNANEDAAYLPGFGTVEALTSVTADNIKTVAKWLPLPKIASFQQVIKLNVDASSSGLLTLSRTDLKEIPEIYDIWLMDNFKKDSLDIRHNQNYIFNIDKSDTSTYGSNRFQLVIRQKPALAVHLLNFAATKTSDGAQTTWKTENEQNYTNFTVERSIDAGQTFTVLGGMLSTASATYSLLDKIPANGINQYRLKIEDLNGAITYSTVISLDYSNSSNTTVVSNIKVYPNPAVNTLNLAIGKNNTSVNNAAGSYSNNSPAIGGLISTAKFTSVANLNSRQITTAGSYEIKIVNSSGAVIKTATSADVNWQTDVSHLLPGTYIIQVVNSTNKTIVGKSVFVKL